MLRESTAAQQARQTRAERDQQRLEEQLAHAEAIERLALEYDSHACSASHDVRTARRQLREMQRALAAQRDRVDAAELRAQQIFAGANAARRMYRAALRECRAARIHAWGRRRLQRTVQAMVETLAAAP